MTEADPRDTPGSFAITVIGTGYLGLTHAVCLADLGHHVLAADVDAAKIGRAARGEVPFFEPGLEALLRKNLDAGRLRFTTSLAEAAAFGDVHFLCVGTPQAGDGAADLSYLHAAAGALAPLLRRPGLVVGKSTVPVGTARPLLARMRAAAPAGIGVDLAWNPEFLPGGRPRGVPSCGILGACTRPAASFSTRAAPG